MNSSLRIEVSFANAEFTIIYMGNRLWSHSNAPLCSFGAATLSHERSLFHHGNTDKHRGKTSPPPICAPNSGRIPAPRGGGWHTDQEQKMPHWNKLSKMGKRGPKVIKKIWVKLAKRGPKVIKKNLGQIGQKWPKLAMRGL